MRGTTRLIAAMIGGLGLVCISLDARAQPAAPEAVARLASLAPGSIRGVVLDERGAPIAGAMVSAIGATTAFGVSDRAGQFELRTLSPGPYLVRAHLTGFAASRGQIVDVHPSSRASSSIALHHLASSDPASYPVLAAGLGGAGGSTAAASEPIDDTPDPGAAAERPTDDHSEIAWRLRHARRSVLKDATMPDAVLADDGVPPEANILGQNGFFGGPARLATSFFAGTPFSGQFNLLTTGSFDSPEELFTTDSFSRGIAYMSVSAPVGARADWTVRGALTQGDISSWIVAGSYVTRAPARHLYDVGLSYSTQRYDAGNLGGLNAVSDGSRNAGEMYGFDTFAMTPAISLTYGARYARYDYLDGRSLLSPRLSLTLSPADHVRVRSLVSRRAVAPGAEEFVPPADSGIWLPPQRTFSSLSASQPLEAERTLHTELALERDLGASTISVRAFRQRVAGQLITAFGVDLPGRPATEIGHYFVGNGGDVSASGWAAGVRTTVAQRFHGSIEYTDTRAHWAPAGDLSFLVFVAPAASRLESGRIHDLATSFEAEVPETSTKVLVLYRLSNAFSQPQPAGAPSSPAAADRAMFDSRFDVQVRQSLPFMDFSSAKWEMLVAVRNFFRETAVDQSVYDELLVVRPPKRIVGGLTLHF
jgi:carboxypeptidase family protein/TonB-dependent receptor-like protein